MSTRDFARSPAAIGFAVLLAMGGCRSGRQEGRAALSGRITIDGVPLQRGAVQFMPLERGQPGYAAVRDGAYAALAPRGRVRVLFSSTRETGREVQIYSSRAAEIVDDLPPALRDGVEIVVDGDDAARHFDLSSRGTPP